LQVLKDVRVAIGGKVAQLRALFDTGSNFTIMGYNTLKSKLGDVEIKRLAKPREVVLVNGQKIIIDAYVDAEIYIDDYMIEERIYLSKDVVGRVFVGEKEMRLPDLIIGAPTMDMEWGSGGDNFFTSQMIGGSSSPL